MPYCRQPFVNIRIDSGSMPQFRPCCHYKINFDVDNVDAYLIHPELTKLQENMADGNDFLPGCFACKSQEAKGQQSWRQFYNLNYQPVCDPKIKELEIFTNNTCNLKCLMCDPAYSTALGAERKKLGWIDSYESWDFSQTAIETIEKLQDLESISLIGGEFFLSKNCLDILDIAVKKKLTLRVITNATVLTQKHIQYLQKISSLDMQISLDGINHSYDFLRYPAKWKDVSNHVISLKKILPRQNIHVNTVVQVLNFENLPLQLDWCNKIMLPVRLTNLQLPRWLEWRILNPREKNTLIETVKHQIDKVNLTLSQKQSFEAFFQTIHRSEFDPLVRADFVSRLSQTMTVREISQSIVCNNLGCLKDLADEVTQKMNDRQ